jgi:hypothetical protein
VLDGAPKRCWCWFMTGVGPPNNEAAGVEGWAMVRCWGGSLPQLNISVHQQRKCQILGIKRIEKMYIPRSDGIRIHIAEQVDGSCRVCSCIDKLQPLICWCTDQH